MTYVSNHINIKLHAIITHVFHIHLQFISLPIELSTDNYTPRGNMLYSQLNHVSKTGTMKFGHILRGRQGQSYSEWLVKSASKLKMKKKRNILKVHRWMPSLNISYWHQTLYAQRDYFLLNWREYQQFSSCFEPNRNGLLPKTGFEIRTPWFDLWNLQPFYILLHLNDVLPIVTSTINSVALL